MFVSGGRSTHIIWLCLAFALAMAACSSSNMLPGGELSTNSASSDEATTGPRVAVVKRTRASRSEDSYPQRDMGLQSVTSSTRTVATPAPPSQAPPNAERIVRVFYATSRQLEDTGSIQHFGAKRSNQLTHGFADVSIPPEHRMGVLERPSIWRFEVGEDARKHVVIKTIYSADSDYFTELLSEHGAGSDRRALVFVHGFATSMPDALMRSAQLKYDLAFKGPVVLFSWPSNGSALAYPPDAANAEWSQPLLEQFLLEIARNPEISEITVLAFSMGAKLTAAALARSMSNWPAAQAKKVVNVVLAAPDIDKEIFIRDQLPILQAGGRRVTLYASENDRALEASRSFHKVQRLGSMKPLPAVARGLDTIDASAVDTSLIGHAYYGDNRSVVSDLFYLIHEKLPPARRVTLRPAGNPKLAYWRFAR